MLLRRHGLSRTRARSTSPTRRSARTPARSWCARCCRIRSGSCAPACSSPRTSRARTRPNAIVVPQLAVQQGSNGHLVYVVKPGRHRRGAAGRRRRLLRREGHRDRRRPERRRPGGGRRRAQGRAGPAGEDRRAGRGRRGAGGGAGQARRKRPTRRRSRRAAHVHPLLHRPADPLVGHLDPDRARRARCRCRSRRSSSTRTWRRRRSRSTRATRARPPR